MTDKKFNLLTPRDWAAVALREANELVGTYEFDTKRMEYNRYMLMADFMDHINELNNRKSVHPYA
jgi:hypothetical protein